jgi:hypothetical protein
MKLPSPGCRKSRVTRWQKDLNALGTSLHLHMQGAGATKRIVILGGGLGGRVRPFTWIARQVHDPGVKVVLIGID